MRTEMIASRYSVVQSASPTGVTRASNACTSSAAAHFAARADQIGHQHRQMRGRAAPVDQQRFRRAANAGAAHFGVEHNLARHFQIGLAIHIDMHQPIQMAHDRHARIARAPVRSGCARRAAR